MSREHSNVGLGWAGEGGWAKEKRRESDYRLLKKKKKLGDKDVVHDSTDNYESQDTLWTMIPTDNF